MDLPPWIMEEPKGGVGNKTKDKEEYWWCKEHRSVKGQWFRHKPEDNEKRASKYSRSGGITNTPSKGDSNKKTTHTTEFKAGLLETKDQRDVKLLLY